MIFIPATKETSKARFHLPGLFEFTALYRDFFAIKDCHPEYFYDHVEIASIYGAPATCLFGGGRYGYGQDDSEEVKELAAKYGYSARLTFSNSALDPKQFADPAANALARSFEKEGNGIIIYSDQLMTYLKEHYPAYYYVSSTTKVLDDFASFKQELLREEFRYVVADFRLNKSYEQLAALDQNLKAKVELLCNECCSPNCRSRKACYKNVSQRTIDPGIEEHRCPYSSCKGYSFAQAMANPTFISNQDILQHYLPMGISNFKIEGRGLGSALIFEFLLYYLVKPQYHIHLREAIYLTSNLDLY